MEESVPGPGGGTEGIFSIPEKDRKAGQHGPGAGIIGTIKKPKTSTSVVKSLHETYIEQAFYH
jgi:hypothetical protein